MSSSDMVGHSLVDIASPTDRSVIESNLHGGEWQLFNPSPFLLVNFGFMWSSN